MPDEVRAQPKSFGKFTSELDKIERDIHKRVIAIEGARPGHRLAVHQAEWHVRGIVYHCRRLAECYQEVAQEAAGRVIGSNPVVVIMYAPAIQRMWFEFYALVNLARITLDHLRNLLEPLFVTEFRNLPKSISGYLKGGTDCPVYVWLAEQPGVEYLSDMRNCLLHFRSFATGDNAVILREGFDEAQLPRDVVDEWLRPMAKGVFRPVGAKGVSVNFYVPDVIFDRSGKGEKLAKFTYDKQFNVLSQSVVFVRLVSAAVLMALLFLETKRKACFHYSKPNR